VTAALLINATCSVSLDKNRFENSLNVQVMMLFIIYLLNLLLQMGMMGMIATFHVGDLGSNPLKGTIALDKSVNIKAVRLDDNVTE